MRDYIHVVDLARGHVAALRKLAQNCGLFTCNLGTGKGYSVLDVLHAYEKACGKTLPYVIDPRRPGDIAHCYADPAQARAEPRWGAHAGRAETAASPGQGGGRPGMIIQNNVGNRHSPTVSCAAITSRMNKAKLPTHVEIDARRYRIVKNSVILLEQIRTIDKRRLKDMVCHLDRELMDKVDEALRISFELHT